MKKIAYIAGGILIGVVLSTAGGAFADTVKSMVGKKVTGEYNIIVNGQTLSDKGAVIDSRANVPARALSEALGADVKVSGKTITITSEESSSTNVTPSASSGEYSGMNKQALQSMKEDILEKIINPTKMERDKIVAEVEAVRANGDKELLQQAEERLARYDAEIEKYSKQVQEIENAIAQK
ncbi:stalk domain-containing protein [Paenibacillus sp. LK1]|uniref:stalk domain-containing protein n=1 Tax=Paenibacillus sp. LK1 TaxID=2053014 RepID=UPI000C18C6F5|nr:stalk domain-containing protein [Paenibacillus sp. LK1]PIH58292.1 copper amine oxidase [Paenibacillus sp. LK1]